MLDFIGDGEAHRLPRLQASGRQPAYCLFDQSQQMTIACGFMVGDESIPIPPLIGVQTKLIDQSQRALSSNAGDSS